jgi:hypothetical protein
MRRRTSTSNDSELPIVPMAMNVIKIYFTSQTATLYSIHYENYEDETLSVDNVTFSMMCL